MGLPPLSTQSPASSASRPRRVTLYRELNVDGSGRLKHSVIVGWHRWDLKPACYFLPFLCSSGRIQVQEPRDCFFIIIIIIIILILLAQWQSNQDCSFLYEGLCQCFCPGYSDFSKWFLEATGQPAWEANSWATHWHPVPQNILISPLFHSKHISAFSYYPELHFFFLPCKMRNKFVSLVYFPLQMFPLNPKGSKQLVSTFLNIYKTIRTN